MSLAATGIGRPHLAGAIDVDVPAASITGLVGANGAGKTTLMRALAGLSSGPGRITLGGREVAAMAPDERARRIAYMPATRDVDWPLAVADIVALGLLPFAAAGGRVAAALERTGTTMFAQRRIDTLSTGERARVLLARAIVGVPDVLLLDEPMANLDPLHRLDVEALLRNEAARGAAVLVSIHDLDHAQRLCNRLLLMHAGAVIAAGAPDDVLTEANVARAFGVRRSGDVWQACERAAPGL
jgi:iron complex transport system ATP-binding protein